MEPRPIMVHNNNTYSYSGHFEWDTQYIIITEGVYFWSQSRYNRRTRRSDMNVSK